MHESTVVSVVLPHNEQITISAHSHHVSLRHDYIQNHSNQKCHHFLQWSTTWWIQKFCSAFSVCHFRTWGNLYYHGWNSVSPSDQWKPSKQKTNEIAGMTQRRTCGPQCRPSAFLGTRWVFACWATGSMLWVDMTASHIWTLWSPTMHRTASGRR